jgi:hypothetical protein
MFHNFLLKRSNALMSSLLVLSFSSSLKSEEDQVRSSLFDVRDKNIGVSTSPNSNLNNSCLSNFAIDGDTVTIFRNSVAEPSLAVNPLDKKQIIVTYEQDVIGSDDVANLGALSIGIAYSKDGGKSWSHSNSLNTQLCNGGFADTVANAQVAYGSNGVAYITATFSNVQNNANTLNQSGVFLSRSEDNGKTWSFPTILDASSTTLDNQGTSTSPFSNGATVSVDPSNPNNVYVTYSRMDSSTSGSTSIISSSTDGGVTFSNNENLYNPANDTTFSTINNGVASNMLVNNNKIISQPNGNVLNFMTRTYAATGVTSQQFEANDSFPYTARSFDIAFTASNDGGSTFNTSARQVANIDGNPVYSGGYTYSGADVTGGVGALLSTLGSNQSFDAAINPENGYIYVVYQTGEFTANQLPQIALVSSRDGGVTFSDPVRVSRTPLNSPNPQAFTPSIAIADNGVVGILYQDFRKSDVSVPTTNTNTKTNVWFAEYKEKSSATGGSTGAGLDFLTEVLVSKHSYNIQTGPSVDSGILTNGNFSSVQALGDDFYATYIKTNKIQVVPAQPLVDNPETDTILMLDNNKRTSPFFSRIDAKK